MKRLLFTLAVLLPVAVLGCGQEGRTPPCERFNAMNKPPECFIHEDLKLIADKLTPKVEPAKPCKKYDPDEVCDGWCEEARGAAKEYKRKFEAMCFMARGLCKDLQNVQGQGEAMDCGPALCDFFGDEPILKKKEKT